MTRPEVVVGFAVAFVSLLLLAASPWLMRRLMRRHLSRERAQERRIDEVVARERAAWAVVDDYIRARGAVGDDVWTDRALAVYRAELGPDWDERSQRYIEKGGTL